MTVSTLEGKKIKRKIIQVTKLKVAQAINSRRASTSIQVIKDDYTNNMMSLE
jgi:hypothetical protein